MSGSDCISRCTTMPRTSAFRRRRPMARGIGAVVVVEPRRRERRERHGLTRRGDASASRGAHARPWFRRRQVEPRQRLAASTVSCDSAGSCLRRLRPALGRNAACSVVCDQLVPAACRAARVSSAACRTRSAGRRRASARHRAGGYIRDAPSSTRASRARRRSARFVPLGRHPDQPFGRIGRGVLRRQRAASAADADRPCGSVVVSARTTIGASRPLAPCTVITRTSSRAISMSRLISAWRRAARRRKPCSDGASRLS